MKYDIMIRGATVVFEDHAENADIAIKDERIVAIAQDCKDWSATQIIEAEGYILMPGAIDTHSHFFEPGPNYREDFYHGTKAAASGGYTTVMDMPNTDPPVKDAATFRLKQDIFNKNAFIDYMIWGSSLPGNEDQIPIMSELGAPAFKAFTLDAGPKFPWSDSNALYEGMQKTAEVGRVFAVHAEDADMVMQLRKKLQDLPWSTKRHNEARPWMAELLAVSKATTIARITGCKLHICHTSAPEVVAFVNEQRSLGADVTIETCPHYLLLDCESVSDNGPYALICPPIRTREQVEKMWDYVEDGSINYIGTDHAPYTDEDKNPSNLWDAPGGAPCIDVAIPLLFDEALKRKIPLWRLSELISGNAAKRFGIYPQKGVIRLGADADLILLDPNAPWTISRKNSFSKTQSTGFAYEGRKVNAQVKWTMVRGTIVYQDGSIMTEPGYGKLVNAN